MESTSNRQIARERAIAIAAFVRRTIGRELYLASELSVQTFRKIKDKKVYYALGFLACFIVVLVVSILMTIIGNAPVVFLRLAELTSGEIDMELSPASYRRASGVFLNYTVISETLASKDSRFQYTSPRHEFVVQAVAKKNCQLPADKENWQYTGFYSNDTCVYEQANCFYTYCQATTYKVDVYVTDSDREKKMDLGRAWELGRLDAVGVAYVQSGAARNMELAEGEIFYLDIDLNSILDILWSRIKPDPLTIGGVYTDRVFLPVKVSKIFSDVSGKYANSVSNGIILEYGLFMEHLVANLNPAIPPSIVQKLSSIDLYQYAKTVAVNLPPPRIDAYLSSNYDVIQENLVSFASAALYHIGFNEVDNSMPVLDGVSGTKFFGLFLGLILNIIIFILLFLSILLIYSLLMISIETQTFELGVLRMLGTKRTGIIELVLLQAFAYSIPAWAIGLALGQGLIVLIARGFRGLTGIVIPPVLTPDSIGLATGLGILIPIVAAIFPIRSALGKNLQDSLDVRHSKTKAVKVSLERSEYGSISWPIIILGLFMAGFGFGVYFIFPLALLSADFALLLNMFFFVLIGMLLGLVVLSLNLQHILEKFLTRFFFFWENRAIRQVVLKNLVAHRLRNRKTTIMYALSLGFIIFVNVSYSLTTDSFTYGLQQSNGIYLAVTAPGGRNDSSNRPNEILVRDDLEQLAATHPEIESHSWVSAPLDEIIPDVEVLQIENIGRVFFAPQVVVAASPNLYTTTFNQFLKVDTRVESPERFTIAEAIYTPEGSKSLVIASAYKSVLDIHLGDHFILESQVGAEPYFVDRRRLKPLAFLNSSPALSFTQFPTELAQNALVSFTTLVRLSKGNIKAVEEVPLKRFLIKLKHGLAGMDDVIKALKPIMNKQSDISIFDYRDSVKPIEQANEVMVYFFNFTTIIAMLICFFSLMSSMYTNIYEQTKEIGILRAMGINKAWLMRIYIYESFILVFSSSVMGMIIGTIVSYTMVLQRILFTQLPVPFTFPYTILISVFVASIIFSILASVGPVSHVVKKSVVMILRFVT